MKTATTVAQMLVRLCGVVLILLGLTFWSGRALNLIPLHMTLGIILVLSLWTLAGLGARAGLSRGNVAFAFLWGLIVVVLGMTQMRLLIGNLHWIIRILHLLVGLGAMGMADRLAREIKQRAFPATLRA